MLQLANDLRHLLSIMTNCVDALRARLTAAVDDRDFADLEGAIDSAYFVSRALLSPSGGSTGAKTAVVNINDLVLQARGVLERILGDEIRPAFDLGATAPMVEGDAVEIEWILFNLAANARDAMPNGGVATIETRSMEQWLNDRTGTTRRPQPYVRLSVTDVGGGMNEDVQRRAFEPFFTTRRGRLGLGLTSAMMTVRRLGGWLQLESTPGVGTHLHVYFPALSPAAR